MAGRAHEPDPVTELDRRVLVGAASGRPSVTVVFADATGAGVTRVITAPAVVGAAPRADIVIAGDPTVSRLHAELDPREDGLWVSDLRSRNGTFVDGVMVRVARVPDGGRLRLGATTLVVHHGPDAQATEAWPDERFGPLVGRSRAMRELFARLSRVAQSDAPVLIHGETGTGKELVAQAIHESGPRASGPLVVVDCGALPEALLEAELFGHAKGAFTGATSAREGAIEAAAGGTLFLDEVGELPLAMQPRLLRALEAGAVRRVGETAYRKVDVRFVAATHRDLRAMVNDGAFREDLYFRLAVLLVDVPPLRERRDDVPALVRHFLREGPTPDAAFESELAARDWPGNVRELRNVVERVRALGVRDALATPAAAGAAPRPGALPAVAIDRPFKDVRDQWLEHVEREYLRAMLARHGGNVSAAAAAAGLDRTSVHRMLRRHGL